MWRKRIIWSVLCLGAIGFGIALLQGVVQAQRGGSLPPVPSEVSSETVVIEPSEGYVAEAELSGEGWTGEGIIGGEVGERPWPEAWEGVEWPVPIEGDWPPVPIDYGFDVGDPVALTSSSGGSVDLTFNTGSGGVEPTGGGTGSGGVDETGGNTGSGGAIEPGGGETTPDMPPVPFGGKGYYALDQGSFVPDFNYGDTLSISAPGGEDIAAFQGEVGLPGAISLTEPSELGPEGVPISDGIHLRWDAADPGKAMAIFLGIGDSLRPGASLYVMAVDDGAFDVSAEALTELGVPSGDLMYIMMSRLNWAELEVQLQAGGTGRVLINTEYDLMMPENPIQYGEGGYAEGGRGESVPGEAVTVESVEPVPMPRMNRASSEPVVGAPSPGGEPMPVEGPGSSDVVGWVRISLGSPFGLGDNGFWAEAFFGPNAYSPDFPVADDQLHLFSAVGIETDWLPPTRDSGGLAEWVFGPGAGNQAGEGEEEGEEEEEQAAEEEEEVENEGATPTPSISCPTATVAHGTALAGQVEWLRQIRDTELLSNPVSTRLMKAYYETSSAVAGRLEQYRAILGEAKR